MPIMMDPLQNAAPLSERWKTSSFLSEAVFGQHINRFFRKEIRHKPGASVGIQRYFLFDTDAEAVAELAEVLDGQDMAIWRVMPRVGEILFLSGFCFE